MTITEKIFAAHAGRESVKPNDLVFAKVDLVMGTDVTVPLSVEVFEQMGARDVFDPEKIALVNDHFVPAKDVKAAGLSKIMRNFARKQKIENYFEVGRSGICHALVPEKGLVLPGDLVVGADSHTCTYGALGAFATGVGSTDMATSWALGENWFRVPPSIKIVYTGRLPEMVCGKDLILYTIGQLGVDGAVYCSLEFIDYVTGRNRREYVIYKSDEAASYLKTYEFDVSDLEPQLAAPYLPSNVKPISEVEPVKIDQVVIGSCTNGRIEDFRNASKILKGKKTHRDVRLIVIPSTQEMLQEMISEGLIQLFIEAGAVISKVYLSSPVVAAASAIRGVISDPRRSHS